MVKLAAALFVALWLFGAMILAAFGVFVWSLGIALHLWA